MRLVIVGGGIAGLAAAYTARTAGDPGQPADVTLLEATDRLGGKLFTEHTGDTLLEWGPDAFVAAKPWARELVEELGVADELVGTGASGASLWIGGRRRPLPPGGALGIPTGPHGLAHAVRHGVLTPRGALRAAAEPLLPGRPPAPGTTLGATVRRRLGPEVAGRLVAPLAGGVYGAPPDELDLATVLPPATGARSIVRTLRKRPPASGPGFLTLRGGMGRLVDALTAALPDADLRTGVRVTSIEADGGRFRVATTGGDVEGDAVVIALPAPDAAGLVSPIAPEAADALAGIRFSSSAVVHLRYPQGAIPHPLEGSGCLAVPEERTAVAACSWVGSKWPHLATLQPHIRAIVTAPEPLALPDPVLQERAADEVGRMVGARGAPVDVRLHRWERALPVYAPGHADRVAAVERALPPGMALAGASYTGLGVPDCVHTGRLAARRLCDPASSQAAAGGTGR